MSKTVSVETFKAPKVSRGTQLGERLLPWLFPIALIIGWQIASVTGLLESRILPAPSAVVV
ncbi:ABC transporter permease, partial [Acinetobacter baumannii]|nr:ABC transporter permease [Acinetobacter baumannii]